MENLKLTTSSRRLMALAAIAAGVALPPQSIMAASAAQVVQQTGVVKGQVLDSTGEPVIGATVKIKGAKGGTVTDLDGNFSLNAAKGTTLEVSYIGYKTQEVKVSASNLQIKLQEDAQQIADVVVVGYGTMRKKDLTGSVVQIRPDKLANENPATVQDLLRGTPGLNVGYNADAKGGGSMQIRGQRSVYTDGGHNDPLIILDGMAFYGELSEIN